MKLSIIIPAYNEEKLIGRCLTSILEAEIPVGYEIIVVNNASTDRTKEIAQSFPGVRVVDEPNKGLTKARQAGFAASGGEVLVYFDADTIVPKDWFKNALAIYEQSPKIVGVSGPYYFEGLNTIERFLEWLYYTVCFHGVNLIYRLIPNHGGIFLLGGNFSIKRWVIEKIEGFNTNIAFYGEDTNLTRRVAKYGKIKFTNRLKVISSPRRLRQQGVIKTLILYISNFFSEVIFKRPISKEYRDIR
jgi:glycosyltransferase involved in cell wall biosynthesis